VNRSLGELRRLEVQALWGVCRKTGGFIDIRPYLGWKVKMPAWSTEIANELIHLAQVDGKAFDQMHLQELVYIAHGWCLAITRQPLTGDRPEALKHGPDYRRLSDALVSWGIDPIIPASDRDFPRTDLDPAERELLVRIYAEYGVLKTSQLATLTRDAGTPWEYVYAGGAGECRDIPHRLIRAQFLKFTARSQKKPQRISLTSMTIVDHQDS
jgi:uncharacterized phage-associated protein